MPKTPPLPIPVLVGISAEEFRTSVHPLRRPVVLRGLDLGPCLERWQEVSYVHDHAENKPVKIHVTTEPGRMDFRAKNFKYATLPLHEVLRRASGSQDRSGSPILDAEESYYLRSVSADARGKERVLFDQDFPDLAKDLRLPELFDPESLFSSVLRVSSPGIRVWTHYDVLDNVYVQIVGSKKAVLWAPSEALNLYLDGDKSAVIDIESPDLERFPKFQTAQKYEADLEVIILFENHPHPQKLK